jgi:hypothetical protein
VVHVKARQASNDHPGQDENTKPRVKRSKQAFYGHVADSRTSNQDVRLLAGWSASGLTAIFPILLAGCEHARHKRKCCAAEPTLWFMRDGQTPIPRPL